ncbi:MAG: hypothetical protein JW957_01820 [Candidatus Omnitrophica bacterium]|nr:hypothetical protein [Candidatus Omnitrophota bacterium]
MLTEKENFIRNVAMSGSEWTPCHVALSPAAWDYLRDDLEEVVLRHPSLFPRYKKGTIDYDNLTYFPGHGTGKPFTDAWGCTWETAVTGIEGVVTGHPINDWKELDSYSAPDPLVQADRGPANWKEREKAFTKQRHNNQVVAGGLPHGFFFMRLQYLRGFENLMFDMLEERPELHRLITIVLQHNITSIKKQLLYGLDVMWFGEDLGSQTASIIRPAMFEKWILPHYRRMFGFCRKQNTYVSMHSDGYIMELVDMLIDAGVSVLNLQDLCNGLDNIERELKGRITIRLDVDRQKIVPFGKPNEIRELIKEEFMRLGSPQGGLEMLADIYPPTPPENIEAVCSAFEEFRTYWFD